MKILIACEYSGLVREAFKRKGHDVISCDILDTEIPGKHYKGDVFDIINDGYDMLIGFPPCTYLSSVQTHLCRNNTERVLKRIKAAEFFMKLINAQVEKIAIENPTGVMTHIYRSPDQIVHPYFFGDTKMKRTCFWLKNLPKLIHVKQADLFNSCSTHGNLDPIQWSYYDKNGFKKNIRWVNKPFMSGHERSRLSPFLANAMADQWG